MAAFTPFRAALVHPPATVTATITGTLAVTLSAVTLAATGTAYSVTLAAATGIGNLVPTMSGSGPVAVGPNVVAIMPGRRRGRR